MTPEQRAAAIRLYVTWNIENHRSWDDVRADIAAAIQAAVEEEREACAQLVETEDFTDDPRRVFKEIATAIRSVADRPQVMEEGK